MKWKVFFKTVCILLTLSSVLSCSVDRTVLDSPNKSDIIGYVNLYNESTLPIDKSGMTVSLVSGPYKLSSMTDVNGKYIFKDISYGIYNLVFEKQGFGTFKKIGYEHFKSGEPSILQQIYSLGQESSTEIIDCSARIESENVIVSVKTQPSGNISNVRYIRCFLSSNSNVSSSDYQLVSQTFPVQINPYEIRFKQNQLLNFGLCKLPRN